MYYSIELSEDEKATIRFFYDCFWEQEFLDMLLDCTKLEGGWVEDIGGFSFATEYQKAEWGYFGETGVSFNFPAHIAKQKIEMDTIISNEDFYKILEEESEQFNLKYPDRAQEVEGLLAEIKIKLLV